MPFSASVERSFTPYVLIVISDMFDLNLSFYVLSNCPGCFIFYFFKWLRLKLQFYIHYLILLFFFCQFIRYTLFPKSQWLSQNSGQQVIPAHDMPYLIMSIIYTQSLAVFALIWQSCIGNRNYIAHKHENIFYVALYRKILPTYAI